MSSPFQLAATLTIRKRLCRIYYTVRRPTCIPRVKRLINHRTYTARELQRSLTHCGSNLTDGQKSVGDNRRKNRKRLHTRLGEVRGRVYRWKHDDRGIRIESSSPPKKTAISIFSESPLGFLKSMSAFTRVHYCFSFLKLFT